jgi:hypothetical protein
VIVGSVLSMAVAIGAVISISAMCCVVVAVIMTLGTKRAIDMNLIRQSVLDNGTGIKTQVGIIIRSFMDLKTYKMSILCKIAPSDE